MKYESISIQDFKNGNNAAGVFSFLTSATSVVGWGIRNEPGVKNTISRGLRLKVEAPEKSCNRFSQGLHLVWLSGRLASRLICLRPAADQASRYFSHLRIALLGYTKEN